MINFFKKLIRRLGICFPFGITIEECRRHLEDTELSNEEILKLRDALYNLAENLADDYVTSCGNIEIKCKKL